LSRNEYATHSKSNKKSAYHTQLTRVVDDHEAYIDNKLTLIKANIERKYMLSYTNQNYRYPRKIIAEEPFSEESTNSQVASIYANYKISYKLKTHIIIKPRKFNRSNSRKIGEFNDSNIDSKTPTKEASVYNDSDSFNMTHKETLPALRKRKIVFHKRVLTRLMLPLP
jgi:hypothetical protein